MPRTLPLSQITTSLEFKTLFASPDFKRRTVQNVVASDLMSDVLVVVLDDVLLITSLASDQMVRTADLVGAAAVVLVNGKQPPASLVSLAKELEMTLLLTPMPKYETCLAIGKLMESEGQEP